MQQAAPDLNPPNDLVELGRVVGAYGVRGWVKIQPHASGSQVLREATVWWLKAPQPLAGSGASAAGIAPKPVPVLQSRPQGASVVAQLQDFADRTAAESLKAYTVWVPRSQFPTPDADEYYWVDLIGCLLYGLHDDQQVLIGQVSAVADNGAHAVLEVQQGQLSADGQFTPLLSSSGKPVMVLVPFVQAHVHTVDLAEKRLYSNWPADF